jgi:hypothetical protein
MTRTDMASPMRTPRASLSALTDILLVIRAKAAATTAPTFPTLVIRTTALSFMSMGALSTT